MNERSPVDVLADQRMVALSADIEAQLLLKNGTRPVVHMLHLARRDAAAALVALAQASLTESIEVIRALQSEVRRYEEIFEWLRKIVLEGFEADDRLTNDEREEMRELLVQTPEGQHEAVKLGLIDERLTYADTF